MYLFYPIYIKVIKNQTGLSVSQSHQILISFLIYIVYIHAATLKVKVTASFWTWWVLL